jgi:hypothetical protein
MELFIEIATVWNPATSINKPRRMGKQNGYPVVWFTGLAAKHRSRNTTGCNPSSPLKVEMCGFVARIYRAWIVFACRVGHPSTPGSASFRELIRLTGWLRASSCQGFRPCFRSLLSFDTRFGSRTLLSAPQRLSSHWNQ